MAYEFKKLSDVNILEEKKTGLNVLVEDAGEIVKISNDDLNPHNVFMFADASQVIPNHITAYFQEPISTIVNLFQDPSNKCQLYRVIIPKTSNEKSISCPQTSTAIIKQEDDTFDAIVYYGDHLRPVYLSSSNNSITFVEDWAAPVESIPAPATASVGQVIAVKAVDENGKPTEWEAVSSLNHYVPFHNNGGEVFCALSFAEADAIVSNATNTASASLNINNMNSGILEASTYYSNCITCGLTLGEGTRAWLRFEFILPDGPVTYQFNPDETVVVVEE